MTKTRPMPANLPHQVEKFDLTRPTHLLANDLLKRIEVRNRIQFGPETHRDVEMLIKQLRDYGSRRGLRKWLTFVKNITKLLT